ncbi:hypothetical protein WDV93_23750 [Pantoea ananatis]
MTRQLAIHHHNWDIVLLDNGIQCPVSRKRIDNDRVTAQVASRNSTCGALVVRAGFAISQN